MLDIADQVEGFEADDFEEPVEAAIPQDRLRQFADANGDISELLDGTELSTLGSDVVEGYELDLASINQWREAVKTALDAATQSEPDLKTTPWTQASNVNYPIITVASQQFAGRAYPAIVKGDQAVSIKVLGDKPEPPQLPPNLPPEAQAQLQGVMQQFQAREQQYAAKEARAKRVKTFLNYRLFYGMKDWEADVDALLNQLPIVGMAFKKVYHSPVYGVCAEYVSALHLTVHMDTTDLERCPRVTQDFELYPYEIEARMRAGVYRTVTLGQESETDKQAPRTILEQHRLDDLDGDGLEEPYIVTVDRETQEVLRVEAAYAPEDVIVSGQGEDQKVVFIRRWMPFVAYQFMPDPKGRFYGLGFGQLLSPLSAVINTLINQMIDAATAANAGGGFIASGLRFQGNGQTNVLRFQPGEYKVVSSPGGDLRNAVWERTVPNVSPVSFQMLELVLGAAKDIAAIKDVLTGEAPSTAPVGTTLALIEQGLQQFTAIYKRIYRSLKEEFKRIYQAEGRWGGAEAARFYQELLDDPQANFEADFATDGYDIVPVSDPTVVTKAQQLAKAQFAMQFMTTPFANGPEIMKRALEAADIDNPGQLIAQPPAEPPPQLVAELEEKKSKTALNMASAEEKKASAMEKVALAGERAGIAAGDFNASAQEPVQPGGLGGLEGGPADPMGGQGAPLAGGGAAPGLA